MTIQFSKQPIAVLSDGLRRTSRYAGTYARWQRDPEGIGGALRAKGERA